MSATTNLQVLLSIRPEHADNIIEGVKTVEFRRRFPADARVRGATVWIYSTAPVKQVIGVATVMSVERLALPKLWTSHHDAGAVDRHVFDDYFAGVTEGHAILLSGIRKLATTVAADDLKALDFSAPQSYRFVTEPVLDMLRERLEIPA